jgi:MFS family permease
MAGTSAPAAAASPVGGTLYAWYVVAVLLLAQACSFLDRMIMGLLVGPIRDTFDISDTQYSLLAGLAFSLFYALMGFPLARIADRGSRRLLIGAGIAVWSVMTAVCGLARNFLTLFVARVGVGVGEASLGPAAYSMIADYFPRHLLARALSVYMIGVTVGSGLAYMIGGGVIELVRRMGIVELPVLGAVHGWQLTFFLVGLPGLLIALLMFTVREPTRRGLLTTSQDVLPVAQVIGYLWRRRRAYGSHFVGISIFVMAVYGLNLWGPTYLIRVLGYAPAAAGWTFGLIMMGAGTAGLLLAGTIADAWVKQGRTDAYIRVILVSMLMMLPFIAALGFVTDAAVALPVLAIAIFFSAFQGGLAGGSLQIMTPNEMRGQAMAVYLFVANLIGLGLGPTVVAAITDYGFGDDGAVGKSLAVTGAVMCPLGALVLVSGLGAIRRELEAARTREG